MRYEIRPLGPWIGPVTENRRSSAVFRTPWAETLDLLNFETAKLGAQLVVIQVDAQTGDVRRDGMLRADAKVGFPGVRVSFTSDHGPLTYATDAYEQNWGSMPGWQANVRAIALSLQALRAVDRYGVSRRGEQYRGWTAITAGSSSASLAIPAMTVEQAAQLLAGYHSDVDWQALPGDRDAIAAAYRRAARQTSPDAGGDPAEFTRVVAARDRLYTALTDPGRPPGTPSHTT